MDTLQTLVDAHQIQQCLLQYAVALQRASRLTWENCARSALSAIREAAA